MAEDTTTVEEQVQPSGADEALPVETPVDNSAETETVTEPSESTQDSATEETPAAASDVDDKLAKYAQSQGLELDSPNAIKAAQIAMKAQSEATRNYHKASELENSVNAVAEPNAEAYAERTGENPELAKQVQRLMVKETVRDFWSTPLANGQTPDRAMEQAMITELQAKPHLAGDLESLYATAQFKSSTNAQVKSQGAQEALQSLAHKQQAAVPTGHATNPNATPDKRPFAELSLQEMEQRLGTVRR